MAAHFSWQHIISRSVEQHLLLLLFHITLCEKIFLVHTFNIDFICLRIWSDIEPWRVHQPIAAAIVAIAGACWGAWCHQYGASSIIRRERKVLRHLGGTDDICIKFVTTWALRVSGFSFWFLTVSSLESTGIFFEMFAFYNQYLVELIKLDFFSEQDEHLFIIMNQNHNLQNRLFFFSL